VAAATNLTPASVVDSEAGRAFRQALGGAVLIPGDAGYEAARRVWNGMIDKRPALIVRPRGAADVQRAVAFARERDLPLSIKGGGHNVAGLALVDGGLTLDLSGMRGVWVDPAARLARVQGGALWSDFDRETAAFGLATTGGVISSTGVGGLTLGGGVGWLVGKHALSVDNLRSADLVTADGEQIRASATEHPDLFWAVRGGGGNFGVVTSFEFRLHPQGDVLAGAIAYPMDQARDVLEFYRAFTATCPEALTVYCTLFRDRDSRRRIVAFVLCWPGDLDEGVRVLAPLRAFGTPLFDKVGRMPYAVWQGALDVKWPHGRRYYWKGNLLRDLPDDLLDAAVAFGAEPPIPWGQILIEFYAGAMNRVGVAETAYAQREARYQFVMVGASDDPADDAASVAWVRELHARTERHALNGAFLNFNAVDGGDRIDRVRAAYGPNWERLVAIKRRYDPTNFFRVNNNVVP
ncbi:MAG TPA: FAD-binding oxidoreductase, partial [Thermomicrobiales bacterium]|nr:FAD-binding oxidoreductase [Thermomicrobiales bacterium]